MAKIKFPYLPYRLYNSYLKKSAVLYRPNVEIKLSFGKVLSKTIDALLDSGADRCIFPISLGEIVGIDFRVIEPVTILGIGDFKSQAYPAKVGILVGKKKYESEVFFSEKIDIPILGRGGFFDLFKSVKFMEKQRVLELEY